MKIGINALGLRPASAGGVEIYFRNLIKNICEFDKENEYYIFLDNKKIKKAIQPYINSKAKIIYFSQIYTFLARVFLRLFIQPKTFFKLLVNEFFRTLFSRKIFDVDTSGMYGRFINLDRFRMDVIHFPFTTIDPSFFNIKSPVVLTVHDIQQEYYPEFFDRKALALRRKHYQPSVERADIIIALSEATKKTLVEKYGVNPEKVIVTYQGCSRDFRKIDDPGILSVVRERYALPDEFMIYPAATWPHKNHLKLLEAILILKEHYSFEKELVLTGIPKNDHRRVMESVERLNLANQVKFLHFVPFGDLPVIYNLATIMVFPSLFEGFGIPLVEAMSVGLPIVCSDRTSIPEIVGDAGIYFNPDSGEDIAENIYQIWQDDTLKEKLIEKGFKQVERFTWEQIVKRTITAYERATDLCC